MEKEDKRRPETKFGSSKKPYCFYCGKEGGHLTIVCGKCGGCHADEMCGLPKRWDGKSGTPIFEPSELGYLCPEGHRASQIQWSEFEGYIWCCKCEKDIPSKDCQLQRPIGQKESKFNIFVSNLELKWGQKANVIEGVLEIDEDEWS